MTCNRCGSYHPGTLCKAGLGLSYFCGGVGHSSWNCLKKKKQDTGRAQQQGRIFTMSVDGAERSNTLIRGNCEIGGKTLIAYDLQVHTPPSEAVVTRLSFQQVSFQIKYRTFVHDMICLPMTGLDLILGLDWLSKHHVLLDCSERSLQFMSEGLEGPVVAKGYYLNYVVVMSGFHAFGYKCIG
ncbi:uncharacterized protein LOC107647072 [Arachis ipaensis]|uniref:uncharacterized protein LOC107647072 n=1 Tax=Arachis ipaensis TaxID=130454 RepID=UPI0007AFBD0E|nr:uncharacterized protein LOC107647072 [Arachis ipaensis]XP_025661682.1 uncharacterized protein LOC112757304 [Arachis hypogaea]